MGKSPLIRRGTQILVVLIAAVLTIAILSGKSWYPGTTARLMSATMLEYNNIKNSSQDEILSESDNITDSSVSNDISGASDSDLLPSEKDITDISEIPTYSLISRSKKALIEEETTAQDPVDTSETPAADTPAAEPVYKYAIDVLNIRKGPGSETEKLGTLSKSERVQSFEVHGEYIRIKTDANIEGYVLAEYVADSLPPVYKYITDTLNIRKGPDSETEKLGTLTKGDRVQVFEVQGEYIRIKTAGNIEGYVLAKFTADSLPAVYRYISAEKLNVRKGPSVETEKLGSLSWGDRVQYLGQEGDWALIITSGGIKGYSLAEYVIAENVSISRAATTQVYNSDLSSSIIEYAKQFLGVPYVYGGSTPKGFDCSGFTQYVFNHFNIKVPRSAKEYANVGAKVSRSDMKPGDIILFDRYDDYLLGHVGISLGGDQFIHASTSKGKVVIGYLSKYGGNILGIRRVIK